MKKYHKSFILIALSAILAQGCATATKQGKAEGTDRKKESAQEVSTALKSVVEAVSQQELSDKDLRRLSTDIRKNKETQSAVQSITDALEGKQVASKYCPLDGKRYSGHLEYCPGTDVPLEVIE